MGSRAEVILDGRMYSMLDIQHGNTMIESC